MDIVTILGATGSVGRSAADVLLRHRARFAVGSVVGGRDAAALARLAKTLGARFAALADEAGGPDLKAELSGSGIACGAGEAAVLEAVERDADIVLSAISGAAGLKPTHAALKPGRKIALANKETLVCAGHAFMGEARRVGAAILAVDSEHNALHQALAAGSIDDVVALILTASGGPFRTWSSERMRAATPAEASAHPTYAMGAKINIDSATLMNKGLELIEAHHLFGLPAGRLAGRRPSPVDRARARAMARRLGHRGARRAGHADPDRPLPRRRRPPRYACAPARPRRHRQPHLRAAGRASLSVPCPGPRGLAGGGAAPDRPQRRQRDRRGGLHGRPHRLSRHRADC